MKNLPELIISAFLYFLEGSFFLFCACALSGEKWWLIFAVVETIVILIGVIVGVVAWKKAKKEIQEEKRQREEWDEFCKRNFVIYKLKDS